MAEENPEVGEHAGEVGGALHVTIEHADGLRTSSSFLYSLTVNAGNQVRAGDVIGIAGGAHKSKFLVDELKFDAAIDYKNENVAARLDELAPDGINVFFDNVGGDILDDVLMRIVEGSRIVICGGISQYENMDDVRGPKNYLKLAERRARMEGFAVFHFAEHYARAEKSLADWLRSGELVVREQIEQGVENFPAVMNLLMTGGHYGKLLLKV